MNLAVVALAVGVCTAGGAGCAANLAAGAAAHLIFCTCDLVAAGTARRAVDTERRLIDVTGQGMGWATRAATGGADTGAGDAERPVGDEAARLVIGTGAVPAIFSFGQTFITDPGAVYRACFKGMLSAAPTLTTCTRLDACLADQMRCALTAAYLRHNAATCATGRRVRCTTERINIKRKGECPGFWRSAISAYTKGVAVEWPEDSDGMQQAGTHDQAIALAGHIQLALFFRLPFLAFLLLALLFRFSLGGFLRAQGGVICVVLVWRCRCRCCIESPDARKLFIQVTRDIRLYRLDALLDQRLYSIERQA